MDSSPQLGTGTLQPASRTWDRQQDTIVIRDLAVSYSVGVTDAEREQPQRLLITIELEHNFSPAVAADDLNQTIDYFAVCQRLLGFGHERSWKLIETLAVDIALLLRSEFGAGKAIVEVKKFIIPQARHVSVRATRLR